MVEQTFLSARFEQTGMSAPPPWEKTLNTTGNDQAITRQRRRNASTEPAVRNDEAVSSSQPQIFTEPQQIPDQEALRRCGWEISEAKPADNYNPAASHVGLAMVAPTHGYAHWRIDADWIEQTRKQKGGAWNNCRMILRLYNTTCIEFNGYNAHRIQNMPLNALTGHMFFNLPGAGTTQLAEVGFELSNREFIAAARSEFVTFAPDSVSGRTGHGALLVVPKSNHIAGNGASGLKTEPVANLWEQESVLIEKRRAKLNSPLRIATLAFEASACGQQSALATFVTELASAQVECGHVVHVFVPRNENFRAERMERGVVYHPLDFQIVPETGPVEIGLAFARAVERSLSELPPFDLFHLHEWMAALAPWIGTRPAVLSLSSIETTRLNGAEPTPLSLEVQKCERASIESVECVLTPEWLRSKAISEYSIPGTRVHAFPMEGRLCNEWDSPLEPGAIKQQFGVGPVDRMVLYVGPLEHDGGADLLIEAMPVALKRCPSLRLCLVGQGSMWGHLQNRANELGVGWAVRLLGHQPGSQLVKLLRVSEGLVLPSRRRVAYDENVVDLARRAGKPVVTTHGGPVHLVRHEENGIITYDNPGSMVWALDRLLGDPAHAQNLGARGRRNDASGCSWKDVAQRYLDLCAETFPELTRTELE